MSEIQKNEVEELLLDNINGSIEDATKELILFSLDVKETVGVSVTTKEVMTLCIDDGTTVEVLMGDLVKKYNYTIDCSALAEKLGEADEIYGVVTDIYDLGNKINRVFESCEDYFEEGENNPILASKCVQNIFSTISTISSMAGGPLGNIISNQFALGEIVLEEATNIAIQYDNYYKKLDEVWQEIEEADMEIDSDLQTKINDVINNSKAGCESYEAACIYDIIMKEYGWLFELVDNEETRLIKEQYEEISSAMSSGASFMEMYNNVFNYASTTDYLGNVNTNDYTVLSAESKKQVGNAKGAEDNADPIIFNINVSYI